MKKKLYTKNYFFIVSIIIFLLGLVAFSDNFLFDVSQESNSNPVYIIHGLLMYSWIIVLMIQTNRIRNLKVESHKKLGIVGFILAALFVCSAGYIYLFVVNSPWDDIPFFGKANRIFLPTFAILILLAYLNRSKAQWHKHLIFVGLFLILEPILSRVCKNTGLDSMTFAPLIWILFWISLFVYDILNRKKLHPLTYLGPTYWIAIYAIVS